MPRPAADGRRCPQCGAIVDDPNRLVDHYFARHVGSSGRRGGWFKVGRIAATLGVVLGTAGWVFGVIGVATGAFEKETVSATRGSIPDHVARELKAEGEIEDFRPVEPDGGWDVEYEFEDPSGSLRSREAGSLDEVEIETFDGDLEDALEAKLEARGFEFD